MQQIVTTNNVNDLEYGALVTLLHDIYCREVPEIGTSYQVNLAELEKLLVFFSNQYAYMTELWGTVLYQVRVLKRAGIKEQVLDDAIAKRDFLEKVMSTCKLKADKCSVLLRHQSRGE